MQSYLLLADLGNQQGAKDGDQSNCDQGEKPASEFKMASHSKHIVLQKYYQNRLSARRCKPPGKEIRRE